MASVLTRLDAQFDLSKAQASLNEILQRYPFTDQRRQISLTHANATRQNVDDGIGTLFNFETKTWNAREGDFRHFSNEFHDTYFFEIYQRAQTLTEGKIGRVRLMNLPPKACYSLHVDPTERYHLALTTNDQAYLIFAESGMFSIPADGRLYRVDTRRRHTAMNGGTEPRVHLVMSAVELTA